MSDELKPCPLCGSTNVTCFAEYDGDNWENTPVYRAVAACLGCHEDGCDPDYDEEPCFGIEAYYTGDHPLIRDEEDPEDCERVLARHMAERWNRRAERTCRMEYDPVHCDYICASCGERYETDMYISISGDDRHSFKPMRYCPNCGARVMDE